MPGNQFFVDPDLQTVRITDFTPGVVRYSRGVYPDTFSTEAPLGSASVAYRCWAAPGVGLIPFATYYPTQTYTRPSQAYAQMLSLANMLPLAAVQTGTPYPYGDSVVAAWFQFGGGSGGSGRFEITRGQADYQDTVVTAPTSIFVSTGGQTPFLAWPTMDYGLFHDSSAAFGVGYRKNVITTDPYNYNWISVGSWDSPASPPPYETGALPAPSAYTLRVFYHSNRMGFFHAFGPVADTAGFTGAGQDFLHVTGGAGADLTLGNWIFAGFYYPEISAGSIVAAWGSVSTGELFFVYAGGGAVIINGDMYAPTSTTKLPAVVGPGDVFGQAALTAAGLVYATETDGAYLWNGDNTSHKISNNVPDDELIRSTPGAGYDVPRLASSNVAWGAQVMFPNNWLFDTVTGGWWQVEDPSIINFQVHAASTYGPKSFLSAPGFVIVGAGVSPSLTIYGWDRLGFQSSYVWISNPLPATQGALVSLQTVEIVASNPTGTAATITVTPTVPAGQQAFQNQNQSQPAVFTIPAHTVAWRGSQRVGYTDYNVQVRVDAANTNTSNPGPALHELTVAYTRTRVSGVQ